MKSKINNTIKYTFVFIILLLFFYNCKTKTINYHLIDNSTKPTIKELSKKYYKYDSAISVKKDTDNFIPIVYTNIERKPGIPKFPRSFFRVSKFNLDDMDYFIKKLNGEYVLYMEKEGRIIMREYAKWYDFDKDRHTKDSIKVLSSRLDSDEKIFNYLKKNNIKYKLISKKTDGYYKTELKILLEANQYYTYITYSPNFIVTNIYYNTKDTITLNNNFGRVFFKF